MSDSKSNPENVRVAPIEAQNSVFMSIGKQRAVKAVNYALTKNNTELLIAVRSMVELDDILEKYRQHFTMDRNVSRLKNLIAFQTKVWDLMMTLDTGKDVDAILANIAKNKWSLTDITESIPSFCKIDPSMNLFFAVVHSVRIICQYVVKALLGGCDHSQLANYKKDIEYSAQLVTHLENSLTYSYIPNETSVHDRRRCVRADRILK
jgi:hypothetical protein